MPFLIPRLVTVEVGRPPAATPVVAGDSQPLCMAELISLIETFADLGVDQMRLHLYDLRKTDDLARLIEYTRRRHLAATAVCHVVADPRSIGELAVAKPVAIAIPIHSHSASVHRSLDPTLAWSRSIYLASVVRQSGVPLEIETVVTVGNVDPLLPLHEVVRGLRASSWHLDFSAARLPEASAMATAVALLHMAAMDDLRLSVQELPCLGVAMAQQLARLTHAKFPGMEMFGAAEALHVSWSGDVLTAGHAVAGNVREQTIPSIYELAPAFLAQRSGGSHRLSSARPADTLKPAMM